PDAVIRLFSAHGKHAAFAAWSLLFYALWHQVHIVGRKPDGDALAMLACTSLTITLRISATMVWCYAPRSAPPAVRLRLCASVLSAPSLATTTGRTNPGSATPSAGTRSTSCMTA